MKKRQGMKSWVTFLEGENTSGIHSILFWKKDFLSAGSVRKKEENNGMISSQKERRMKERRKREEKGWERVRKWDRLPFEKKKILTFSRNKKE